jgi:hypothetical protein
MSSDCPFSQPSTQLDEETCQERQKDECDRARAGRRHPEDDPHGSKRDGDATVMAIENRTTAAALKAPKSRTN